MNDDWISTLDRLPPVNTRVLATVYDSANRGQQVLIVDLIRPGEWWCAERCLIFDPRWFAVSHWKPLPAPAKRRKIELIEVSQMPDGTIDPAYRVVNEEE